METPKLEDRKLTPADLVAVKPDEAQIWRREAAQCAYDHTSQTRHWEESATIADLIRSTGAPTSSTNFDGEKEE